MQADAHCDELAALLVDGGASQNSLLMQVGEQGRGPAPAVLVCRAWTMHIGAAAVAKPAHSLSSTADSVSGHDVQLISLTLSQMQADILQVPVRRPAHLETTSLGAALAAGIGVGFWTEEEAFTDLKHNTGEALCGGGRAVMVVTA